MLSYSSTALPDIAPQTFSRSQSFVVVRSSASQTKGGDLARAMTVVPLFHYTVGWLALTTDQMSLLHEAALILGGGPWATLNFFEPLPNVQDDTLVEVADGATSTYDLPGKQTSGLVVRVNGSVVAVTLLPEQGADGEDQIVFGSPPQQGSVISASWTFGRRRRRVSMAKETTSPEFSVSPNTLRWSATFELQEVPVS